MLSIELKRTDQVNLQIHPFRLFLAFYYSISCSSYFQVKFVKKLQKYIKNEFGADMWDRMAGRVQDFENLREDIRQGVCWCHTREERKNNLKQ